MGPGCHAFFDACGNRICLPMQILSDSPRRGGYIPQDIHQPRLGREPLEWTVNNPEDEQPALLKEVQLLRGYRKHRIVRFGFLGLDAHQIKAGGLTETKEQPAVGKCIRIVCTAVQFEKITGELTIDDQLSSWNTGGRSPVDGL